MRLSSWMSATILVAIPLLRMLPSGPTRTALAGMLHAFSQWCMLTVTTGALAGSNHEFERFPALKGSLNGIVALIEGSANS